MKNQEELLNEVIGRDDLLQTVLRVLKPPGEAVFFLGGAYVLEAVQGLSPGGIMLICAGDPARVAEALGDYFSVPPIKVTWQNEVWHIYPEGKTGRGITVMPMGGVDIGEHLRRAGFTVHAMAADLGSGPNFELIDPLGGLSDLNGMLLKRSARGAVADNPDRALTAVDLMSRYGLQPDEETDLELNTSAIDLENIPPCRAFLRILRMFEGDSLSVKAKLLRESGIIDSVFPELKAIYDVPQNYYHNLGVWDHTMETLDNIEEILGSLLKVFPTNAKDMMEHLNEEVEDGITRKGFLAFAGLVHDIGKAGSMTVLESGRIRFKGHEMEGARVNAGMADRLGISQKEKRYIVEFTRKHMDLGFLMHHGETACGRLEAINIMGDQCVELSIHALADRMSAKGEAVKKDSIKEFKRMIRRVVRDYFWLESRVRLIDGNDVIVHGGVEQGPQVGEILMKALVAQREGLIENRQQALEYIAPDFKGKMKC